MGYEILTLLSLSTIGLSGILIVTGLVLVKMGMRELHRKVMLTASFLTLLFLIFYGLKYIMYPPKLYEGPHRGFYLFVMISHSILATLNIPLAAVTVFLGFTNRLSKHRKIAPITAAVWIYVALSGWVIFALLKTGG